MMFGITDPGVALAFILMLASAALCVVYGALNWNKPQANAQTIVLKTEEKAEVEQAV